METRHVSRHYAKRSWRHSAHWKRRFPKVTALCDVKSHVVLGGHVDRGPKPDVVEFPGVLTQSLARHRFRTVLGDAGYESERAHVLCRETLGVRSIFPTTVRGKKRKDGGPRAIRSPYRLALHKRLPKKEYGQRAQIETVFSMVKRNLGSALRARKPFAINREVTLRAIVHNLMILKRREICFQRCPPEEPRRPLLPSAVVLSSSPRDRQDGSGADCSWLRDTTAGCPSGSLYAATRSYVWCSPPSTGLDTSRVGPEISGTSCGTGVSPSSP